MSKFTLEIRRGEATLRALPLAENRPTTLGRGRKNDVVLPHKLVSNRHATIVVNGDGLILRDLGSTNGTWLNGKRVANCRRIEAGDKIRIGGLTLVVRHAMTTAEMSARFIDEAADTQQIFAQIDAAESAKEANRNLAVLHEMGGLLLDVEGEDDLCNRLLELVFDVLPADRACVILTNPAGELKIRTARARKKEKRQLALSRTILRRTVMEGISLLTSDAEADERFSGGKSIILQHIRAAMCAPIRGKEDIVGALYVDTQLRRGAFKKEDLELLTTLGIQGGIAIQNLRLVERNLRAERLATIGSVVAGLGHDIRNILTAVKGGAYMLDRILAESTEEDAKDAWGLVREGADRIGELVEDMVSYSKAREPDLQPTDLNALVSRVATRFATRADEAGVSLVTDLDPHLGEVSLEAPAVDRVLSNLVANALDALAEADGIVTLRTAKAGEDVELVVKDTGPGIPPEHRERIFDLLFSSKGKKGTGFGLAVTRKIVSEHGGTVEVESELGSGATFRVLLPRH